MLVLNGVNPARGVLKWANGGGRKDNAVLLQNSNLISKRKVVKLCGKILNMEGLCIQQMNMVK